MLIVSMEYLLLLTVLKDFEEALYMLALMLNILEYSSP